MAVYDQEVAKVSPPERKAIMQIVNEWDVRGHVLGEAGVRCAADGSES